MVNRPRDESVRHSACGHESVRHSGSGHENVRHSACGLWLAAVSSSPHPGSALPKLGCTLYGGKYSRTFHIRRHYLWTSEEDSCVQFVHRPILFSEAKEIICHLKNNFNENV